MRLLKVLGVLILAAVAGLAGYAYLGDMRPVRSEVRTPIGGAPSQSVSSPAAPSPPVSSPAAPSPATVAPGTGAASE